MITKRYINVQYIREEIIEETEEKPDFEPDCFDEYDCEENSTDYFENDEWEYDTEMVYGSHKLPENGAIISPTIWKDPNLDISAHELTAFDMAVIDAVYAWQRIAKKKMITSMMIRRIMSGNPEQTVREDMKETVEQSMSKLQKFIVHLTYEKVKTKKQSVPFKEKVCGSIIKYLEKFKEDKWISGYEIIRNGRRVEGVEIFK